MRLYDLIKSVGAVSASRLERAAAEAGRRGATLASVLVARGDVDAERLAELASRLCGVPRYSGQASASRALECKLPHAFRSRARVFLFSGAAGEPVLGMTDPTDDDTRAVVESLLGQPVAIVVLDEVTLSEHLARAPDETGLFHIAPSTDAGEVSPSDFAPAATHVDLLGAHRTTSSVLVAADVPTSQTSSALSQAAGPADAHNDLAVVDPTHADRNAPNFITDGTEPVRSDEDGRL